MAYSLGNFWFSTGTLYTTVAQVVIEKDGSLQLKFVPCLQKDLTTSLITDKTEKDDFYHYIAAISSNIGIDADGNVYNSKKVQTNADAGSIPAGLAESADATAVWYDSDTSQTTVRGGSDNEGYKIDIVGNRKTTAQPETVVEDAGEDVQASTEP